MNNKSVFQFFSRLVATHEELGFKNVVINLLREPQIPGFTTAFLN